MVTPKGHAFAPPVRRAKVRLVVGALLCAVLVGLSLLTAGLFLGARRVEYVIGGGALAVRAEASVSRDEQVVPLATITSARRVTVSRGRRVHGTGLPGYCAGWFTYAETGRVWAATDCSRDVVVIDTRGDPSRLVVAPADRERFLAALAAGTPGYFAPAPSAGGGLAWPLFIAPGLCWAAALLVLALTLVAPGRLRYVVAPGTVTVQTLFLRRTWSTDGMTARRHRPAVGMRLFGTAMPGYYTGWYRVDGQRTLVYATDTDEGVLLEGAARVYLTPEDAGAFLDALRRAGARVDRSAP